MLQYRTGANKDSMKKDFVIVLIFIVIIAFLRKIIDVFAQLPAPWNMITQTLVFVILIALCYMIYKSRISDYRYTVIYAQPAEGEENVFGKQEPYPWPVGTVLFERMVANKGRLVEKIEPAEFVAMTAVGEDYSERISLMRTENMANKGKAKSRLLVYRRDGKLFAVRFVPSEEFAEYIDKAIAASRA